MPTVEDLAIKVGVDQRTLQRWFKRGCPRTSVKAINKWRENNISSRQPADIEDEGLASAKIRAEIAKLEQDAEAKRLRNAQLRGELYDAREVETDVAELTGRIRLRLESIPDELQTEWPAEVRQLVTERLADKIHLILTELSQWRLSSWNAETEPGDRELPPAAEAENDSLEL